MKLNVQSGKPPGWQTGARLLRVCVHAEYGLQTHVRQCAP